MINSPKSKEELEYFNPIPEGKIKFIEFINDHKIPKQPNLPPKYGHVELNLRNHYTQNCFILDRISKKTYPDVIGERPLFQIRTQLHLNGFLFESLNCFFWQPYVCFSVFRFFLVISKVFASLSMDSRLDTGTFLQRCTVDTLRDKFRTLGCLKVDGSKEELVKRAYRLRKERYDLCAVAQPPAPLSHCLQRKQLPFWRWVKTTFETMKELKSQDFKTVNDLKELRELALAKILTSHRERIRVHNHLFPVSKPSPEAISPINPSVVFVNPDKSQNRALVSEDSKKPRTTFVT